MKFLVKITIISLILVVFVSTEANAQSQDVRREKEKQVKTKQADKSVFGSQSTAETAKSNLSSKRSKKVTIWDVVPAEGFIATGNLEQDKKAKMNAQRKWIKSHPEEFLALIESHGIKPKSN